MKRLFSCLLLLLFTVSPLQAAIVVTSEWASVELNLAFEANPHSIPPSDYDDLVFRDSHTGGIEFDMELTDAGTLDGSRYSANAIAKGFRDFPYDIGPISSMSNPVFGTFQIAERGDSEAGEYASSLIDAIINFNVIGGDANSAFRRIADSAPIDSDFSYTLYDLTDGTAFVAPDLLYGGGVTELVTLLDSHSYALSYHSLRNRDDGTNQFAFFTDTNVIYTSVPAPSGLLLFAAGLLGLTLSRKRQ